MAWLVIEGACDPPMKTQNALDLGLQSYMAMDDSLIPDLIIDRFLVIPFFVPFFCF